MSCQIILVDRGGELREKKTKNINALYKVCNYRNDKHFGKQTTWNVKINNSDLCVELWAKTDGMAGNENKYDFPPPVDKCLYFGICCLVCYDKERNSVNLSKSLWKSIYEKLFGGFEDLGESDEEMSVDSMDEHETTKQGYSKEDGFIVSDDEEILIEDKELSEDTCSDSEESN
tara:strand:+ start:970 stop:1491 length:522 start_codon:yes stop_codon:yes gene_type:complete